MPQIEEVVHNGRDNAVELALSVDGVTIDHTSITRALLVVGTVTLDSQASPALFDFTQADRLVLTLGAAGLTVGRHSARLITYDTAHPNGLEWESAIVLLVKD